MLGGEIMGKRLRIGVPMLVLMMLMMTACSFGSATKEKEMDTPPVSYIDEGESLDLDEAENSENSGEAKGEEDEAVEEEALELIERELYLIDENGLVVPQTFEIPKTEGVLKQSLEYLVDGGPITELLPNGFQAVLPAGTIVDVNLKEDGLAIADFSNEFKEYNPDQEKQILQAITWTLTQFDNVNKVQILINGHEQETMPQQGTPIGKELSRADGINIEKDQVADIVNSKGVTLYFLAQNGDNTYYVPVTRRVSLGEGESLTAAAVKELLNGPSYQSPLLTDFRQGVMLQDEPEYSNGEVTLNFNEAVLSELQSTAISKDVLNMLALTLTEQEGIERVAIEVNGEGNVLTEGGTKAEPVSRPELINAKPY